MKKHLSILIVLLFALPGLAATRTFNGGTGVWATAANWQDSIKPTSADDVVVASGVTALNINETAECKSLDVTAATGALTLSGSSNITIYGNLTLQPSTNFTHTGKISFSTNTCLVTSAGKSLSPTYGIEIISGTVQLVDNLSTTKDLTLTSGTLDLNGKTLTVRSIATSNSNAREIKDTAGGAKIVLGNGFFGAATATNLEISNAPDVDLGDGTTAWTGNATFNGAGKTWGDILVRRHPGNYYVHIDGSNTFSSITLETPDDTNYPYTRLRFAATTTQTIGSLSGTGTQTNPVEIFTNSAVNATTLSDSAGSNVLSYAKITTIAVTGGATWDVSDGTSQNIGYNSGWAWPPRTYYVSNSGTDDTGSESCYSSLVRARVADTPLKTVARLVTCVNAININDTILFKRGDTFAEQLLIARIGLTFGAYGTGALPRFTGATFSLRSDVANQTFQNLWLSDLPVYFSGTASGTTLQYSVVTDITANAIQCTGTTANIINNTIHTMGTGVYVHNAAANVAIKNNLIIGGSTEGPRVYRQSGACTLTNNLFSGANARPDIKTINSGCTDGGGNIGMAWTLNVGTTDSVDARITSVHYPKPRVAIIRDDRGQVSAFLADITAAQSMGVSAYKETLSDFAYATERGATEVSDLQAAIDAGHEVVLHSATGSAVGHPSPYTAFTVSTTNTGTNTLTIDASGAKTLTLTSSGNPENNISIDWSSSRKDVCAVKAALGQTTCTSLAYTGKGWTITPDSNVSAYLSLSSLADLTCSSFPCTVALDKNTATNRFLYDEIVAGKDALEADLGRTVYSFLAHQLTDSISTAYIKESGLYKGQRSASETGTTPYLSAMNVFLMYGTPSQAFAPTNTTDEATCRANTRTIWGWAQYSGGVIATYFHGTNYITSEQVGWIVDELNKLGVVFMTFSELVDWIKSDHDTADGYTYTKTYPNTSDYRLRAGSPAINAGVDVGLTTDADGKPIIGLPDIGAYEYQPTGIPAGLFIGRRHKHMIQ